ncbi:hypothetical protein [uncultured Roseobacter sp.]|uniref:hypothetical protein n=1 Tax=uncultured Roseobacter sp. TaxID=114847 RepID=UPI00262068D0|nr:hypothetical protein [uncultured Roseobacter sp.]
MPIGKFNHAKPSQRENKTQGWAKSRGPAPDTAHNQPLASAPDLKTSRIGQVPSFQLAADLNALQTKADAATHKKQQLMQLQSAAYARSSNLAALQAKANAALSCTPVLQRVEVIHFIDIAKDNDKIESAIWEFCENRNHTAQTRLDMITAYKAVQKGFIINPFTTTVTDFLVEVQDQVISKRQPGGEFAPNDRPVEGNFSMGSASLLEDDATIVDPAETPDRPWKTLKPVGDETIENYVIRVNQYVKHVKAVTPEELGNARYSVSTPEWLKSEPIAEDKVTDKTGLLSAVGDQDKDDSESDSDALPPDWTRKTIRLVVGKARQKFPESEETIVTTAVLLEEELTKVLKDCKNWKEVLDTFGVTGPIAAVGERVMDVILTNLDSRIKELVPWSTGRKARDTGSKAGEGVIDISYNVAGFAADAATFGVAAPFLGMIGGAYKGGFSWEDARRAGASKAKADAIGVVTFMLQAAQGSIPFYGGALGILGGVAEVSESIKPKKRLQKVFKGYSTLRGPGGGDERVTGFLIERIAAGNQLIADGIGFESSSVPERNPTKKENTKLINPFRRFKAKKASGAVTPIEIARQSLLKKIKYLNEQLEKSEKRFNLTEEKSKSNLLPSNK